MNKADLQYFAREIHKELGIVYVEENFFQLEKRLVDAMRIGGFQDEATFLNKARLGLDPVLKQLIFDLATNNETSFFRDSKIFNTIETHVVPEIMRQSPSKTSLRVWCAASSFGQEPYSLAMTLHELRKRNPSIPRFEIIATDISEAALKRAKSGSYSSMEIQRGLVPELRNKYFTAGENGTFNATNELKFSVTYKKKNLLESFQDMGTFDLVLCRNVLIYQQNESKTKIIERLAKTMNPHSYLFLGAAESLMGISTDFEQQFNNGTIYFQKKDAALKSA